ncbi:MAG TPA: hypothetical protein VNV13_05780 [Steroidobacteraceae bacterium]|nr:hypothetical protein [Steroidobacteraceae bacterium]
MHIGIGHGTAEQPGYASPPQPHPLVLRLNLSPWTRGNPRHPRGSGLATGALRQ